MKLLSITVNKKDTTSFYRANGVFGDLKQKMNIQIHSIDGKDMKNFTWADINLFDVVFMQRPYTGTMVQMAQFLSEMKIPLWIDFDDNLFEIPRGNRAADMFSDAKIHENIQNIAKFATVITVTTPHLANVFSQINPNVQIIPNAINTNYFPSEPPKTQKTVLWRGSDTHFIDQIQFIEQIIAAQSKFTEYSFTYFGYDNPFIPTTKNFKYLKPTDPILYFKALVKLAPQILQVPLIDLNFNRCKSNIAYLEGSMAGAVCIVPDWPEWNLPGAITYSPTQPETYLQALEKALSGGISLNKLNIQARKYITENLTLKKVNNQRVKLLKSL